MQHKELSLACRMVMFKVKTDGGKIPRQKDHVWVTGRVVKVDTVFAFTGRYKKRTRKSGLFFWSHIFVNHLLLVIYFI